jgi:uncharacterized protein YeaO (DUF488 family)
MLLTKRIYDKPERSDGTRVLVMRLWPRGIKKSAVDLWLKELGAEISNLRAFKAGRIGWPEMRRRYLAGLRREPAASALKRLRAMARRGRVTALCSCADPKRCHRSLLRAALGVVLVMCIAAGSLGAGPALAEHEVQFRYTVLGYVKDSSGKPRKGVALEVTRQKTGLSYPGETDASGLYVIVTRLADESRGERLLVRAGPRSLRITAQFDPADHTSERGTRVDFTGARPAEHPELFASTLKQFLSK